MIREVTDYYFGDTDDPAGEVMAVFRLDDDGEVVGIGQTGYFLDGVYPLKACLIGELAG